MMKISFLFLISAYGLIGQAFLAEEFFKIFETNVSAEPTKRILYSPFGSRMTKNVTLQPNYERIRFHDTEQIYENKQTRNDKVIVTKNTLKNEIPLKEKNLRVDINYNYEEPPQHKPDEFQIRSSKNNSIQRNTVSSENRRNKLKRLKKIRRFNNFSTPSKNINYRHGLELANNNTFLVNLQHTNNSQTTAVYAETPVISKCDRLNGIHGGSAKNSTNILESGTNSCTCYWKSDTCGCDCAGAINYDDFQKTSSGFFPCHNFTFTMTGGKYYALPPNFFSKVKVVDFFNLFITNSTFEYLCDPTPMTSPFKGVKFSVNADIRLLNVHVRRGWNWKPFEELRGTSGGQVNIALQDCRLRRLTSDFSNFAGGRVDTVNISNSNLEMVGSSAFGTFDNMTHFLVPENKIKDLRRTDFPELLAQLVEMDLRNNQLNNLDEDLFKNMPHLKEILLKGNPLFVLSEKTFRSVIGQANLVGISDIPLRCDCHLRWLKDSRLSRNAVTKQNMNGAICKRPSYLRGIPFEYLSREHLICR